ncbi:MAG: hypothetical protein FWC18_05965, partial [Cystobacterineae bacterium]|nr:hypothetical protein [Cystobacterineae bacterium]
PSEDVCEAQSKLAQKLGVNRLVMGIMTENSETSYERYIRGVPYGLKYRYLASGAPEDSGCFETCSNRCRCQNRRFNGNVCPAGNEQWWGCWNVQNGQRPGADLRQLLSSSDAAGQIPMVVYYTAFRTIGEGGGNLVSGLPVRDNVRDYFRDWRFMLKVVNEHQQQSKKPVMVHIEPDFWGFAQQTAEGRESPRNLAVQVGWAAEGDCPEEENNFAGLGRCMLRMARHHAPLATIGFMASGWATGLGDINLDRNPNMDVEGIAVSTGKYLNELGANLGDFLVVEFSDRDAAYYELRQHQPSRWYDPCNEKFPNFHRTFAWGKTLADTVKLPLVWWQIPMGHKDLPNGCQGDWSCTWKDNRVDYLFSHLSEVAATQSIALAFGPGAGDQASPATDGGHLADHVRDYAVMGGAPLVCSSP